MGDDAAVPWHEQVVLDRRAQLWRGGRIAGALSLLSLVAIFFFMQWLTAASASGKLRELVAGRVASEVAGAVADDFTAEQFPTTSPIGAEIIVRPEEIIAAKADHWDVVDGDLPAQMQFEIRYRHDGDRTFLLVRNTDDGGGLDAPKDWHCRRVDAIRSTACDPDDHDPQDFTIAFEVTARR